MSPAMIDQLAEKPAAAAPAVHPLDAGKPPEQLVAERNQRMLDALRLQQPDRIPLLMGMGYYLAEMGGVTKQALYDDPALAQTLLERAALEYQPDNIFGAWHTPNISKALGDRMTKWPGYGLGPNGSFQYNEQEYMKAEDYDAFLEDPADWAIRVYTPRVFANCEGLGLLPPLGMWLAGYYHTMNYPALTDPRIADAFLAMHKAALASLEWVQQIVAGAQRLGALGFPPFTLLTNMCEAPFDFMSDTLRGMRGIFLDMLRIPDKLLAAEEKVARFQLQNVIQNVRLNGVPFCFIPLHRGSDGFMSFEQFDRFYWPQLKAMMLELIDNGITPWVYYEGVWDQRLHYLADLPKGLTVGSFQDSDYRKVKAAVGDTMCIIGGMPLSLLKNGTPALVRDHTRMLCEDIGRGGGYIMATNVMELEGCRPDLVKAWADATKEFGVY